MKSFLLLLFQIFCLAALAQHNMQNMPGMNMPAKTVVKKQVQKKPAAKKVSIKSATPKKSISSPVKKPAMVKPALDTMPNMHDMNSMDMKNLETKDTMPGKKMDMNMPMDDEQGMQMDSMDMTSSVPGKVNMTAGRTVRYDLYVTDTMINFTGKRKHGIAINGSIPGPVLSFTEGDTAEIYLHNQLSKEETSLHWHGVILPNQFDGVPYLTTARIGHGETHLYKFRIVQNGTYWYHSHSMLQEQSGMYGALVFNKREAAMPMMHMDQGGMQMPDGSFNKEYTLVLSEWTNEKPEQVQRRLRTGNDWYAIKKGSVQSYSEAIGKGFLHTKLLNEWKRMKAMDVSDVYYDRFLANGIPANNSGDFVAGDKIKIRVVNGGASSYFWLQYAGGKITVIANDGNDIDPVEVDRLIIAPSETYDVVVTIPASMSYEFRATPEDRTGAASIWLGTGMKMPAPVLPTLEYFKGMQMMNGMMKGNGKMNDMGMEMSLQQMDMNAVMYPEMKKEKEKEKQSESGKDTMAGMDMNMPGMNMSKGGMLTLNYSMLRSPVKTVLEGDTRVLHFDLTGNMNRYLWTIDNKTVTESDKILIHQGEVLRVILTNNSMMRHPMHLHGHDFRVLNGQDDYAPLKNVLDIMPMETDTIEFAANQSGDWFFHCHILYHMMAGMGRVFSYENSPPNPDLPDPMMAYKMFKKDNTMHHLMARVGLETNGSDGEAMLSSDRYALSGMWHLGTSPHHGEEAELNFGRYFGFNQWWFAYAGFDYHHKMIEGDIKLQKDYKNLLGQVSDKDNRKTFVVGLQYTLPWLLLADARVDGNGKFRFQLGREDVPVTPRLRLNFMGNTDREYMAGLRYIITKWFAVSGHYDSDMGMGVGVTLTY
jgi:CopA family copper-resistance protein